MQIYMPKISTWKKIYISLFFRCGLGVGNTCLTDLLSFFSISRPNKNRAIYNMLNVCVNKNFKIPPWRGGGYVLRCVFMAAVWSYSNSQFSRRYALYKFLLRTSDQQTSRTIYLSHNNIIRRCVKNPWKSYARVLWTMITVSARARVRRWRVLINVENVNIYTFF